MRENEIDVMVDLVLVRETHQVPTATGSTCGHEGLVDLVHFRGRRRARVFRFTRHGRLDEHDCLGNGLPVWPRHLAGDRGGACSGCRDPEKCEHGEFTASG